MKVFRKMIVWAIGTIILGSFLYLYFSGKLQKTYSAYLLSVAQGKMDDQDYLAAVGWYEKALDADSADSFAHFKMAVALDSLKRPVEAGWHYADAIKYRQIKEQTAKTKQ